MAVPEHLRGPFVQIAQRLRFTKDAPPRADRVSERPRKGKPGAWLEFLDDIDAPHPGCTLVTFDADDAVDVASLLASGAIRVARADQLPPVEKPKRGPKRGPKLPPPAERDITDEDGA